MPYFIRGLKRVALFVILFTRLKRVSHFVFRLQLLTTSVKTSQKCSTYRLRILRITIHCLHTRTLGQLQLAQLE